MSDSTKGQTPRLWRPGEGEGSPGPEAAQPFRPYGEAAAKAFAASFRRAVGQDVSVRLEASAVGPFHAALATSRDDVVYNVLRLDGWRSPALLTMGADLLGLLTDVFFGGTPRRGRARVTAPATSAVTQRLARRAAALFLESFGTALAPLGAGDVRVTRQETDAAAAGIMSDREAAWVATYRLTLLGESAMMTVVLPFAAVRRALEQHQTAGAAHAAVASPMTRHLPGVEIEVVARLGEATKTAREIMSLAVGDVLTLDRAAGEPIELLVEGRPKLAVLPAEKRGHKAFRVVA